MDDSVELLTIGVIIGAAALLLSSERNRRWWVRPWIDRRSVGAGNLHLVHEELMEDRESFKNFMRMDEETFCVLLELIRPLIQKQNTKLRESVSARDRLTITLRYLATGESYRSLSYSFRVGHSTIATIVPEVCEAIYNALKRQYLQVPNTCAAWLKIADEFNSRWNLPNILGALDGKHICFQAPKKEGSTYFNYKNQHSIVLLAVVDADYKFIYVDVGTNGRISDGGVFRKSDLFGAITSNTINIPEERPLPGREAPVPFMFVADAAFPLLQNILKPFPFRNMSQEQRIFNYRLSRARRVVENAFGILSNRFRILLHTINLSPKKVQQLTLTCCVLHNFLKSRPNYNENDVDRRFLFKYALSQQGGNRSNTAARNSRDEFMAYVNGVGAVPWQNDIA